MLFFIETEIAVNYFHPNVLPSCCGLESFGGDF